MLQVFQVALKGIFRDRIFQGIMFAALLLFLIPAISTLSMRQVTALAISLSLGLVSFIQLLLAVFLGGTSLWRDIERRYSYSILGLPLSRNSYLLGKFLAVAIFILLVAVLLGSISMGLSFWVAGAYPPDQPVVWVYVTLAVFFDALKYILLVAVGFLLSTFSTSFFLPVFGTIIFFMVGSATQEVYAFINSAAAQQLPALVKTAANALYYVLPNFSAFDLKVHAIYAVPPDINGLTLTFCYFLVYTGILLTLACVSFSHREMK